MLGRLAMSIDDCIDQYVGMGEKLFGAQRSSIPPTLKYGTMKKNTHKLQKMLQDMVNSRRTQASIDDQGRFATSSDRCRTIVVTVRETRSSSVPYLFRSYNNKNLQEDLDPIHQNPGLPLDCPIWKVCRATTAAPLYFKPMKIEGQKFVDAGFGTMNNPSLLVLNEVARVHRTRSAIEYCLSIGTGITPSSLSPKPRRTLTKLSRAIPIIQQNKETGISSKIPVVKDNVDEALYERWDVSDLEQDDFRTVERKLWRNSDTLDQIRKSTARYISSPDIKSSILMAAKKLVQNRRRRAATPKWESFALGVVYMCTESGCGNRTVFRNRNELIAHMQKVHLLNSPGPDNIEEIEEILTRSRISVEKNSEAPLA